MVLTFEIILLVMMVIGFIGTIGEKNRQTSLQLTSISIASVFAFILSRIIL